MRLVELSSVVLNDTKNKLRPSGLGLPKVRSVVLRRDEFGGSLAGNTLKGEEEQEVIYNIPSAVRQYINFEPRNYIVRSVV